MVDDNKNQSLVFEPEIQKNESYEDKEQVDYDAYNSIADLKPGSLVKGQVVGVHDNWVFVNIGTKAEGMISRDEFDSIKEGDQVTVFLVTMEDGNGNLLLSKKKADYFVKKGKIQNAFKNQEIVEGKIIKEVNGGYIVELNNYGFQAFLPYSHAYLPKYSGNFDPKEYVGKQFNYKIIQYNEEKNNLVVSIRNVLEEERKKQHEIFFQKYKEGDVIEGIVRKILNHQTAIVNLGYYVDSFLHLRDLSWNFVRNFKELDIQEGKKIQVKILTINDKEEAKVQVGVKQLKEDPFITFSKHKIGDIVSGKVNHVLNTGIFVNVEGILGLVPNDEILWNQNIKNFRFLFKKGESVKVKILKIEMVEKRVILLSIKQATFNPWSNIEEHFKKGTKVKVKVTKVFTDFVLLKVNKDIYGILYAKDFDWDKDPKTINFEDLYKKHQELELVVIGYNYKKSFLILGKKQLEKSSLKTFYDKYAGKNLGINVQVVDFIEEGLLVEFKDHDNSSKLYRSIVPIQELDVPKGLNIKDYYKIGNEFKVSMRYFNFQKQMIFFSKKAYDHIEEKEILKNYIYNEEKNSKFTLKDIFNSKKV